MDLPQNEYAIKRMHSSFPFLALPKELRLMIYERLPQTTAHFTFTFPLPRTNNARTTHAILASQTLPLSILLTCRQITTEARPILQKAGILRLLTDCGSIHIIMRCLQSVVSARDSLNLTPELLRLVKDWSSLDYKIEAVGFPGEDATLRLCRWFCGSGRLFRANHKIEISFLRYRGHDISFFDGRLIETYLSKCLRQTGKPASLPPKLDTRLLLSPVRALKADSHDSSVDATLMGRKRAALQEMLQPREMMRLAYSISATENQWECEFEVAKEDECLGAAGTRNVGLLKRICLNQ